jgi:hypothetical protein
MFRPKVLVDSKSASPCCLEMPFRRHCVRRGTADRSSGGRPRVVIRRAYADDFGAARVGDMGVPDRGRTTTPRRRRLLYDPKPVTHCCELIVTACYVQQHLSRDLAMEGVRFHTHLVRTIAVVGRVSLICVAHAASPNDGGGRLEMASGGRTASFSIEECGSQNVLRDRSAPYARCPNVGLGASSRTYKG